jgi:hypothetical protein
MSLVLASPVESSRRFVSDQRLAAIPSDLTVLTGHRSTGSDLRPDDLMHDDGRAVYGGANGQDWPVCLHSCLH